MSEKLSAKNTTLSSRFGIKKTVFKTSQGTNQNKTNIDRNYTNTTQINTNTNTSSNKQRSKR